MLHEIASSRGRSDSNDAVDRDGLAREGIHLIASPRRSPPITVYPSHLDDTLSGCRSVVVPKVGADD